MRLTDKRSQFSGAWAFNTDRMLHKRAIIISGTARGGTSFAASVFLRLGIPFSRPAFRREISRRTHEHKALRDAFWNEDATKMRTIAEEFSSHFDVWAWKLPQVHKNLALVQNSIDNPHFVFVFKEPVSVAYRRFDVKGLELIDGLEEAIANYLTLVRFARESGAPVLFIGYETAISNMPSFLAEAAAFADVSDYDSDEIIEAVKSDSDRYYPGGKTEFSETEDN